MPTVSDSFDRANGALGANWTTVPFATSNFAIASNAAMSVAFGGSATYHNGYSSATGAGTLFSEAVEGGAPTDQGLTLALWTSVDQGYSLFRRSSGNMYIWRNGVQVGSVYTPGSWVAGTIRLEYTRSTGALVAKLNGTTVITHTDGSPLAIERVGMGQAGLGDATASFLSWSGGDDVVPANAAASESITLADAPSATRTHGKDQAESITAGESTTSSLSALPPGTFTSSIFARNGGEENSASTALDYVSVRNPVTGLQLSLRTGLSTNGAGRLVFTDPVMVAGTLYLVDWLEAGGQRGWDLQVAT